MPHMLEWSHAFTGRLDESATEPFTQRAQELATRLRKEVTEGLLPFLSMPYKAQLEKELTTLEPDLHRFRHMLLLGIGGSALGARALQKAFAPEQDGPAHEGPNLWIADNVCASTLESWLDRLEPAETVVVCISKSGGTIETLAQYFIVRDWLRGTLKADWSAHILLITDPHKGFLREEAQRTHIRALEVPDNLGGRYSALSAVGLVSAVFLGIHWRDLLCGATSVAQSLLDATKSDKDMLNALQAHPAFSLAVWARALEACNYSELIFFCYIPQWATFGPWFAQLWAESLGKEGRGMMPIFATGVTDQHSINQMFLDGPRNKACLFISCNNLSQGRVFPKDLPEKWNYLRGRHFGELLEAEAIGTRMALVRSQMPLINLMPAATNEKAAGAMMMLLEITTILTGWLLDINPIDQPAVELGKRLANARLGAEGYKDEQQDLEAFLKVPPRLQEY